ncbi:MAG: hypothetical protein JJU28_16595 [Cyclobacteriaceae bacterium]|nr:hypothetical protein [Cyclobacteriaceae bacterium]
MVDAIIKALASNTSNELTGKAQIPQNLLGEVFKLTGNVATQEVAKQAASGGLNDLMNLFSNKPNNAKANNIQNNIANSLIQNLSSKLGLSKHQATLASQIIIPVLMSLISKENSKTPENDSTPIQKIFEMGGGKSAGNTGKIVGDILGKFFK